MNANEIHEILTQSAMDTLRMWFTGDEREDAEREFGCRHDQLEVFGVITRQTTWMDLHAFETRLDFRSSLDRSCTGYLSLYSDLQLNPLDDWLVFNEPRTHTD